MAFRRGFKTEANDIANEIRQELKLKPLDRFEPLDLATLLEIPVIKLSAFRQKIPDAVEFFMGRDTKAFSAVTVFRGLARTIVYNDAHSEPRQRKDITHELSHALLLHPPMPALNDYGCRKFNADFEDEADWLCDALLVTEQAALSIAFRSVSDLEASIEYGVSEQRMRYRLNVTAARRRAARSSRRRAA